MQRERFNRLTEECHRYMNALAPAVSRAMTFACASDPDGRFRGGINYDGRAIGLFSLVPGTEVPHFVFGSKDFEHFNRNMEYSRHDVMRLDALRTLMHMESPPPLPERHQFYRHYRGDVYFVTSLGRHSKTGEHLVAYQQLDLETTHYRPIFDTPLASDEAWTKPCEDGSSRFTLLAGGELYNFCKARSEQTNVIKLETTHDKTNLA